jgi:RNA polymerase sigma-70 factor (ECF subfamily)
MDDKALVKACIKGDAMAMKTLYERFYALMLGVCLRYVHNKADAEDFVQEGFIKVFNGLGSFKSAGSLEGWVKRVMINNVLMQLRKAKKEFPSDDMDSVAKSDSDEKEDVPQSLEEKVRNEDFSQAELVEMIHALPEGYSRVMNMYVIDKYKHREIAKIMGISEGTSKSQLNRARKLMKQKLLELVLENKGCSQVPD